FFFFQAEDGIRDRNVTGVQTCALPISKVMVKETKSNIAKADKEITLVDTVSYKNLQPGKKYNLTGTLMDKETGEPVKDLEGEEEIGRASCRERVERREDNRARKRKKER